MTAPAAGPPEHDAISERIQQQTSTFSHESGHVVVALALGFRVTYVRTHDRAGTFAPKMFSGSPLDRRGLRPKCITHEDYVKAMAINAAGYLAERRMTERCSRAASLDGAIGDRVQFIRAARSLAGQPPIYWRALRTANGVLRRTVEARAELEDTLTLNVLVEGVRWFNRFAKRHALREVGAEVERAMGGRYAREPKIPTDTRTREERIAAPSEAARFVYAGKEVWEALDGATSIHTVHGTYVRRRGGVRSNHAWIECDGQAWDLGLEDRGGLSFPIPTFRERYQIEEHRRFTPREAMRLRHLTGTYGPWDDAAVADATVTDEAATEAAAE